ncbi:short-chain dehydrogenase [Aspergillus piperis CBS 112811]|uniref:Short-chain dehydrogenase n=1 Tax=Aspergillus piperis CBS 112811 TaxID=1448313 RepID=A0A8G1RGE5_9EURO|nr:short-chain dehydrogenase [Aspergillus piperis CBS 112811]RAH62815.1 short-chain dehydrogenase [Aspergillus piperis CBS 112811]
MSSSSYNYNKLAGKHVLIFGGTSGIGLGVAKLSLAASARVTVSSSSSSRIESTIQDLKSEFLSGHIQGHVCDLSKDTVEEDLEALFQKTNQVDHIVFTATDAPAIMPVQEITREKLIAAGQVRFFAAVLVAKIGSRYLSPGPESSITLTTGTNWERPMANWSAVAGYLGGTCSVARNLAVDLKPIRVNAVSPGLVKTPLWNDLMNEEEQEGLCQFAAAKNPTGRVGLPEEVAEAYIYLMKDVNVTGRIVSSDSGALLV